MDMQNFISQSQTDQSVHIVEEGTSLEHSQGSSQHLPSFHTAHSLSVVLPAHNEEHIIVKTVQDVTTILATWMNDFEVIVVNDGSTDQTEALVNNLMSSDPRIRLVTHPVNKGYGAALVSGFAAATKELTFFMDSDGQFTIQDLQGFLPFIDTYDAVLGYRLERQDTWIRKLNASGWKFVVKLMLGVNVRDIDCAFKLMHTQFLHDYPLETQSAMINAELLYKLAQSKRSYKQIGVHHLPRQGGQATGANIKVILRAFRDLFTYSSRWKQEVYQSTQALHTQERAEKSA
jgi:glycosyltransferase involved in cell wall biosynthesis